MEAVSWQISAPPLPFLTLSLWTLLWKHYVSTQSTSPKQARPARNENIQQAISFFFFFTGSGIFLNTLNTLTHTQICDEWQEEATRSCSSLWASGAAAVIHAVDDPGLERPSRMSLILGSSFITELLTCFVYSELSGIFLPLLVFSADVRWFLSNYQNFTNKGVLSPSSFLTPRPC